MADALQNYIDGKWVDAIDGGRFDVFDPATGEVDRDRARLPARRRGARGGCRPSHVRRRHLVAGNLRA